MLTVTVHVTASHAAQILQADLGLEAVEAMGPAQRIRALTEAVNRRTLIDTSQDDTARIRQLLVTDNAKPGYNGPTQLDAAPTVFDEKHPTGELVPMQTVTK